MTVGDQFTLALKSGFPTIMRHAVNASRDIKHITLRKHKCTLQYVESMRTADKQIKGR